METVIGRNFNNGIRKQVCKYTSETERHAKETITGKQQRDEGKDGNVQCKDNVNTQRYSAKLSRNEELKNIRQKLILLSGKNIVETKGHTGHDR